MARDETRDVWVYGDGNDGQSALAAIEHSRHLELEKNFPNVAQKCERYVPHDQLEAVERERDTECVSKREATRAWFNCKMELAAAKKRITELERLREAAGRAMHRALCMASEAISPDISDAIRAEFTRVFGVATVALGETAEDAMATRYVPHDQLEAVEGERNAWRDDANYQLACLADRKRELEAAQKRIAELTEERDAAVREMAKARSKAQDSDGDCVVAWALASEYAADRGGQFARLFDMLTMARRALKKDAARIAELEQEVRRLRHLIAIDRTGLAAGLDKVRSIVDGFAWLANDGEWGSYDYTNHSSETLRAEIGACFDQVGEVIEATLKASGDRADSAAQNMGEAYPPRCKDGCEHWRAPLGEFFQHAACMHKSGLKLPNDDGSDSCSNHSKLQK